MNQDKGKEEFAQLLQQLFKQAFAAIETDLMEQNAWLSANTYLLELVFANQFLGNAQAFNDFMDAAISASPHRAEPMSTETGQEMAVRTTTRLRRFQQNVAKRLEQG